MPLCGSRSREFFHKADGGVLRISGMLLEKLKYVLPGQYPPGTLAAGGAMEHRFISMPGGFGGRMKLDTQSEIYLYFLLKK
jgi:hypothetical protein